MIVGRTLSSVRRYIPRGPYVFEPVWSPFDLGPKLLAWWDADRADLMTFNAGNIATWADSVAGAVLANATPAQQPFYSTNGYNGSPAAFFDGAADRLVAASSFNFPLNADPGELWGVVDATSSGLSAVSFSYGPVTNNSRTQRKSTTDTSFFGVGNGAGLPGATQTLPLYVGRHFIRGYYDGANAFSGIDGNMIMSGAIVGVTMGGQTVMGASAAISQLYNGYIRHQLVTLPLSGAELVQMNAWAAAQAGLL